MFKGGRVQWAQESFDDMNMIRRIGIGSEIDFVKTDPLISWLLLASQISVIYHCNNPLISTFVPSMMHRTQGSSSYQRFRCTVPRFFFPTPFSHFR